MTQNNTDRRKLRRRAAIKTTAACAIVLVAAAVVTIWAQRTFFPEGILARMMPSMALLYILLLPAMAIGLRTKLRRIDQQEAWEEQWEEAEHENEEDEEP